MLWYIVKANANRQTERTTANQAGCCNTQDWCELNIESKFVVAKTFFFFLFLVYFHVFSSDFHAKIMKMCKNREQAENRRAKWWNDSMGLEGETKLLCLIFAAGNSHPHKRGKNPKTFCPRWNLSESGIRVERFVWNF